MRLGDGGDNVRVKLDRKVPGMKIISAPRVAIVAVPYFLLIVIDRKALRRTEPFAAVESVNSLHVTCVECKIKEI